MVNVIDLSQARQLAGQSQRGNISAGGKLLRALVDGKVFRTYAGNPTSAVVPASWGEWLLDTTNNIFYRSKGVANTDWIAIGTHGLTAAELAYLDGITAGTGLASKAAILDASGNFIMPDNGVFGLSRATIAAAGTTSADATVIADQVVAVTASDGTAGVALPLAATTEGPILVINTVLTSGGDLKVYPVDAGNDLINGGAEDAAFVMGPGAAAWFIPISATQWYVSDKAGVLTTKTEENLLDGSSAANANASVAPILDSTKRMVTTATAGAVGTGVTAVEFSADGINFTTILTLTGVVITIGDTAALSMGALIYTLPAGDVAIEAAAISVGLTLTTGTPTTDTPEVGLGTVIGSGANATLGAVGTTAEDIMEGVVMADIAGTAKANMDQRPMDMLAGAAHTVHLNFADTWADVDNTAATAAGTVTLSWSKLPLA